jgi:hypothetical protein
MQGMALFEQHRFWLGVLVVAALASELIAAPASRAEQPGRGVRIVVAPQRVLIESRGLSVRDVLHALGARTGFTVVGGDSAPAVDEISLESTSIEDLVRLLLRNENYVVVYRQEERSSRREIDEIILSGPAAAPDGQVQPRAAHTEHSGSFAETPRQPHGPADRSPVSISLGSDAGPSEAVGTDGTVGVDGLLRSHVGPMLGTGLGSPASPGGGTPSLARDAGQPVGGSTGQGGGESAPAGTAHAETLAAATLKAQQNLGALVEGLAAATRSLIEPGPAAASLDFHTGEFDNADRW